MILVILVYMALEWEAHFNRFFSCVFRHSFRLLPYLTVFFVVFFLLVARFELSPGFWIGEKQAAKPYRILVSIFESKNQSSATFESVRFLHICSLLSADP